MHLFNTDYLKEHSGSPPNMIHHHGWFANIDLPENPLCWLFGHTPFVYRLPLKYNRPDGATEYRWVECKICGRRSTRVVPQSPTPVNYKGIAEGTERRNGWQGCNAEFAAETVIRRPVPEASARFHLGGRGSETPIDAHLTIAGTGIYVSTSLFSRLTDIITSGDGRELSLSLYDGSVYWRLWVDQDHSCSGSQMHRFGGKYRSWLCRNGSLSTRPLDYLYGGSPSYSYEDVDGPRMVLLVTNEGTEHNIDLTLQRQKLSRPKGPFTKSWIVKWKSEDGIPVCNNDWKGDCIYGSAVNIDNNDNWITDALEAMRTQITRDRQHSKWKNSTKTSEPLT